MIELELFPTLPPTSEEAAHAADRLIEEAMLHDVNGRVSHAQRLYDRAIELDPYCEQRFWFRLSPMSDSEGVVH